MCLLHHFAGAFTHQPEEIKSISAKAAGLIKRAFEEIDPIREDFLPHPMPFTRASDWPEDA